MSLSSPSWKILSFDPTTFVAKPMLHVPRHISWDAADQVDWHSAAEYICERVDEFRSVKAGPATETAAFAKTQLAVLAYETNRLEGTARVDAGSFAAILQFIGCDDELAQDTSSTWDEEGGREASGPSSQRQWFQFCSAIKALMGSEDALKQSLSVELLSRIHGIMMNGSTLGSAAGSLRTVAVGAGGSGGATHVFIDADRISKALENVIGSFNNADRHPIQRAAYLLHELLSIHPFINGNGRLARLFFSWSLMRDGFPFAVVLSSGHTEARDHYLHAIERARGQVTGTSSPSLVELNGITLISLLRVLRHFDEVKRLEALDYVAVDAE